MITDLSKKEQKESFLNLLNEIRDLLKQKKDFLKLKEKSKELSDLLGGFADKKPTEIINSRKVWDSPLDVLLSFYEPRNVGVLGLKLFFEDINRNNDYSLTNGVERYVTFFDQKLIPFYTRYPKQ